MRLDPLALNPLLAPLHPDPALASGGGAQLALALLSLWGFISLCRRDSRVWGRPAFFLVALFMVLYQWPLVAYWGIFRAGLPNAIPFSASIHALVLLLLAWLAWSVRFVPTNHPAPVPQQGFSKPALLFLALSSVLLLGLYLRRVNVSCTGLHALMFDPPVTLLAREMSLKLLGASVAAYAYGAFANAVAPLLFFASMLLTWRQARTRRMGMALLWLLLALATLVGIMLPGIKGMLVPTLLVFLLGQWTLAGDWRTRSLAVLLVGLVGMLMLTSFELLRDQRSPGASGKHAVGQCAQRLRSCAQVQRLIASASQREGALELPAGRLALLHQEVARACGEFQLPETAPALASTPGNMAPAPAPRGWQTIAYRAGAYLKALAERALVIPLQVGGWHFLYAAEQGAPGWLGLPLAQRFSDASLNMPFVVYQHYGSVFSLGDRTSTSTSPTTFLLSYPAYLGGWGLGLACCAVLAFDLIGVAILRHTHGALHAAAVGLFGVAAFNMMSSDFFTVLSSHGAVAGMVLVVLLGGISHCAVDPKRCLDAGLAGLLLLLSLPVLLVLALLARLFMGSPVLFRQQRPGRHGVPFTLIKFRSMLNAHDDLGRPLPDEQRLARFGRFLRATSLDELPELWNVLKGEMSLVGPRPLLMEYLPLYSPEQARRHLLRPGITGWAQVNGRNTLDWEKRLAMDVWYVDNRSLWLDMKILGRTLTTVFSGRDVSHAGHATMPGFTGTGNKNDA